LASPAVRLAVADGGDGRGDSSDGRDGRSHGDSAERGERPDGALSADGQIFATYVHGLFDTPAACAALLGWAGLADAPPLDYPALREASLDRLADTLAAHLDLDRLFGAIG
jgi:adenosylcobyric acid synthase